MTNFKASNPLPSSCPNTSNPTHSFQGAPTAHSSPNDPFGYVAGAFSCLANLRPPNMSSTHPNVCEETDSLWFDTLREVAFHFVKIGETIEHCAVETERIIRGNEERASLQQSRKCSGPARGMELPPSNTIYMKGNARPQAPNGAHSQDVHHPQRHENSEPVLALNRFAHQTPFPNRPYDQITPTQGYTLKRYSSVSLPELEQRTRTPLQLVTAGRRDNIRTLLNPRGPRPNKRIRNNWTDAENALFFDIIKKNANEDETTVLREAVSALHGSRSWVQCKGHFRNLLSVGKITQNKKGRQLWEVHEEASIKSEEAPRIPTKALTSSKYEEPRGKSVKANGSHISSTAPQSSTHNQENNPSSATNVNTRKKTERQDNIQNNFRNGTGAKTGRSASIDCLINNISQERDNRKAQMLHRTNAVDGDQSQREIIGRPRENSIRSNDAHFVAGSEGVSGEQDVIVGRDRETAIFMSKQAAAKEAFERSNPDATRESDIRAA